MTPRLTEKQKKELLAQAELAYEHDEMAAAIEAFTLLAHNDVAEACQYLGLIYRTGDGGPDGRSKADVWYSRYLFLLRGRAESGDLDALLNLGKHYQYGDIVGIDPTRAVTLISEAASKGLPDAQFHLACFYLYGWSGCPIDLATYSYWLDKAVESNHPEALYTKGLNLIAEGDDRSRERGKLLIEQAAHTGFWPAQEYLASKAGP